MNEEKENEFFKKDLEKTYDGFVKAINNKDFDKIAKYYTKDCSFLWENGPKFIRLQIVIPIYKTLLKNLLNFQISIKEVSKVNDTRGIEFGEHRETMKGDNQQQAFCGRYVIDWEKTKDGLWQVKNQFNLRVKEV